MAPREIPDELLKLRATFGGRCHFGPAGIHFFDRSSGLNVLFDEVRVAKPDWSIAPRYMSIALTNACELACAYCYASKEPAKQNLARLLNWTHELSNHGCLGVGFGGGEPTLYPRFVSLCRAVRSQTQLAVSFTTHGHRFTQQLSEELKGSVDFIRLSMDGIGSTYERLRGRPFEAFREKLAHVRDCAPFGINFVVNRDTIGDLQTAADFAVSEGASELLLLPETDMSGEVRENQRPLETLKEWVENNYRKYRLATSAHSAGSFSAPLASPLEPNDTHSFMHIDALGTLKKSAFEPEGVLLGDDSSLIESIIEVRTSGMR